MKTALNSLTMSQQRYHNLKIQFIRFSRRINRPNLEDKVTINDIIQKISAVKLENISIE
jgi:hypothetical protein